MQVGGVLRRLLPDLRRGGLQLHVVDHVGQLVVRPLEPIQHGGLLQGVEAALPVHHGPGVQVHAQQHGVGQHQNGQHPPRDVPHPLPGEGQGQGLAAAQADQPQHPEGQGEVGVEGEHDLHRRVPRHEDQRAAQGRRQGAGRLLRPAAGLEDGDEGGNQGPHKEDQAHHAGLHQGLDIVVVGVLGLVEEGLDADDAVLKGAHTQADDGAALEELHAVLKEHHALDGVLVGPQALHAVGDEVGQQGIAQGELNGAPRPLQGRPLHRHRGGGGEVGVYHDAVLRHRHGGPVRRTGVDHRAGVHHGVLPVLALQGHADLAVSLHGQGVAPRLGIGGPAQALPLRQGSRAGQLHGGHGEHRQQDHHHGDEDGHHAGAALQQPAQLLPREPVGQAQQGGAHDDAGQGHRLEAAPLLQGGGGHQEAGRGHQDQGLHHEHQQRPPALLPLQQQEGQKAHRDGAAAAHAEGQEKGQGVEIEAGQVEPAVALPLGGNGQAQGEEHPDAHAPGEHVGVAEDGGHAHPRLHAAQAGVVPGEQAQQAQHRGADEAGGEQVDAGQSGQGGSPLQHGGEAPAQLPLLPLCEGQQQHHAAEGGQHHHKGPQGELARGGVQGGDAVHDDPQAHDQEGHGQTLRHLPVPDDQGGDRAEGRDHRDPLGGGDAAQADHQKVDQGEDGQAPDSLDIPPGGQGRGAVSCFMARHAVPPNSTASAPRFLALLYHRFPDSSISGTILFRQFFLIYDPFDQRHKQNLDVEEEIPVLDVVNVVADARLDGGVPPQAVDLGPAGDAGTDLVLHHVQGDLLLELPHIVGHLRPGTHQAHVPLEDVEELGQLVDGQLPQDGAKPGLAVVHVPAPAGVLVRVDPHGAELVHFEELFVPAHPLLPEDHRPGGGQPHPDGRGQHDGGGAHDEHQGTRDVHQPLEGGVDPVVQGDVPDVHQGDAVQVVDLGIGGDVLGVEGDEGELDPLLLAGLNHLRGEAELLRRQGHHHLVRVAAGQHLLQGPDAPQVGDAGNGVVLGQVAVDQVAVLLLPGHHLDIPDRHVAVPHQQHMLLVEAPLPEAAQQQPQAHPLAAHAHEGQAEKQDQGGAGEVDLLVEEQPGLDEDESDHAPPEHPRQLPEQGPLAQGFVQTHGGEDEQVGGDEEEQQEHVLPQRHHGHAAGQDVEADEEGRRHGSQEDKGVQDHVDEIQGALIFLYHVRLRSSLPRRAGPGGPALRIGP